MMIDFLKKELARRQRKNPNYSLRAFAKTLKIESSTLIRILKQTRKLTPTTARKILDRLEIDSALKNTLLLSVLDQSPARFPVDEDFTPVDADTLALISAWECYALLCLFDTPDAPSQPKAIAKVLNSTEPRIRVCLSRMETLGLIRKERERWKSTDKQLTTSRGIPSASLTRAHRSYLAKALYSLKKHTPEERDISGITMAIDPAKLPEAFRRIREFRRSLAYFMAGDRSRRSAVYRLNLQLFPLKK